MQKRKENFETTNHTLLVSSLTEWSSNNYRPWKVWILTSTSSALLTALLTTLSTVLNPLSPPLSLKDAPFSIFLFLKFSNQIFNAFPSILREFKPPGSQNIIFTSYPTYGPHTNRFLSCCTPLLSLISTRNDSAIWYLTFIQVTVVHCTLNWFQQLSVVLYTQIGGIHLTAKTTQNMICRSGGPSQKQKNYSPQKKLHMYVCLPQQMNFILES